MPPRMKWNAATAPALLLSLAALAPAQEPATPGPSVPYHGWVQLNYGDDTNGGEFHRWNTDTGAIVSWTTIGTTITYAEYKNPLSGQSAEYRAKAEGPRGAQIFHTGRVLLFHLHPPEADLLKIAGAAPLTFPELLANAKRDLGEQGIKVTPDVDRGMTRYHLERTVAAGQSLQPAWEAEMRHFSLPIPSRLWVDPATQQVRQIGGDKDGEAIMPIKYDMPAVNSIYDIGVPKDAAILDGRPDEATIKVFDRVIARIEKHLPDGVAVMVERHADKGRDARTGAAVFEIAGKNQVQRGYDVTENPADATALDLPPDWTAAGGETFFKSLAPVIPNGQVRTDGVNGFRAKIDPRTGEEFHASASMTLQGGVLVPGNPIPGPEQLSLLIDREMFLGPNIYLYPLKIENARYLPSAKIDLIASPDRPGLLAFHIAHSAENFAEPRGEDEFWIDPAHDDRPVYYIESDYKDPKTKSSSSKIVTEFGNYVTLPAPDGRSVPTTWTEVMTRADADGKMQETSRTVTTFHFFPGKKLPALRKTTENLP